MKTKKIILNCLIILIVTAISFIACKKDTSTPTSGQGSATYNIYMTDSPGDYQEVNINVIGAEVHSNQLGWMALHVNPGVYNLLKLSNGIDTLIASGQIPVGTVSQIRLILGENNNTVKINNQIYPLETPSSDQSGLKLQVHSELIKNITYNLILDFDAGKSVVLTGNNTYKLKPVIRVITSPTSGAIQGSVVPIISQPAVLAILGTDTFGTYANIVSGGFLIQGLAAGKYKVMIMPKVPFHDTTFSNVSVNLGAITAMGIITVH